MYSSGVTVSITLVSITFLMFDSLTVHHPFEVVDFYGTGTIDLFDNVRTFPFREKLSGKKS